jgi:hypothetical protein
MNMATKHSVLQAHLKKWLACRENKKKRGVLTTELSSLLSMHEKSVGRAMKRLQKRKGISSETRGRPVLYGADVTAALIRIWEVMDYPCAENMPLTSVDEHISYLMKEKDWPFTHDVTDKLLSMSEGTKKLRIASVRKKRGLLHGRSATISSPLKGMIPIRKSHTWHDLPVGYVQTDSVVHCGDLLTGDVVYSVGCVDFRTYWSEYTAQWNKGQYVTCESLQRLRGGFPFSLQELHPDTGNEFINYHVQKWAQSEGIALTRSEPYKKNDNMCIEERNNSIARKHLGYVRLDDESFVSTAREILETASLLHNHFRPVRRMISKERCGSVWKRTYEKQARTPYERVLTDEHVSPEVKAHLTTTHTSLSPLVLKRKLDMLKGALGKEITKKRPYSPDKK